MSEQILIISKEELGAIIERSVQKALKDLPKGNPPEKNLKSPYLNIEEAAKLLNLARTTLYNKTSKGTIPHYKLNGKLLFKAEELMEYVEKSRKNTVWEEAKEVSKYLNEQERRSGSGNSNYK